MIRLLISPWAHHLRGAFDLLEMCLQRSCLIRTQMLKVVVITYARLCLSSVQFSRSVVSSSLRLHGLQHARPPCPSPTPGVYSNSCPSSW